MPLLHVDLPDNLSPCHKCKICGEEATRDGNEWVMCTIRVNGRWYHLICLTSLHGEGWYNKVKKVNISRGRGK